MNSPVAIASDHAGFSLKEQIRTLLEQRGIPYVDFGTSSEDRVDYPDYAVAGANAVGSGAYACGILVCGSGIGMSIVANKVSGVRAAECLTVEAATLARQHNDANVLTLGQRLIDGPTAEAIVCAFLDTPFEGGRHQQRVDKIHSLTGR